ncbi:hypothetical protein COBT_000898 [Conglomerata obtusa]
MTSYDKNNDKENKCVQNLSIKQDFNRARSFEQIFSNIEKNMIIANFKIKIPATSPLCHKRWLQRLDFLFNSLKESNLQISDKEKINIAIGRCSDDIFDWYSKETNFTDWNDFKNRMLNDKNICMNSKNKVFKINNWVKIFDNNNASEDKSKFETGLISNILDKGFYEVVCKGKILKIHEICLEEL